MPFSRIRVVAFARRHWVLLTVLAVHAALWTLADRFISPHPDFIDHWVQSRWLSWGYYEHPPMVAWLIHAMSLVLGNSEAALEAMAIMVNLAILAAVYAVAARNFGVRSAVYTLLCLEATPYFAGGSAMLQIDQPLMLCWLGALAALLEYRRSGRPAWLLAVGVMAGLGGLSKYTMVLFYLAGLVYLIVVPERRADLRRPWVYAAGLISLLLFAPVLAWNAEHDWFSFRYQLSKAGGPMEAFPGKHLLEFTFGYVILFSPVLVAAAAAPTWRHAWGGRRRDSAEALLAVLGLVPIAFFTLAMIRGSFPDPKWANTGFLGVFILLGRQFTLWEAAGHARRVRRLLGGALALNAAVLAVFALHTWHPFLPFPATEDPTQEVVGWNRTAGAVDDLLHRHGIPEPHYVIAFTYPLASQFALHLPSQPFTHSLKRTERNLWSRPATMDPARTIVVCRDRSCDWVASLVLREFGWPIERLGTVRTTLWGVPRHAITVWVPRR